MQAAEGQGVGGISTLSRQAAASRGLRQVVWTDSTLRHLWKVLSERTAQSRSSASLTAATRRRAYGPPSPKMSACSHTPSTWSSRRRFNSSPVTKHPRFTPKTFVRFYLLFDVQNLQQLGLREWL